jgi:hypothetical protein
MISGNYSGSQNSGVRIQNGLRIELQQLAAQNGQPFATPPSPQIPPLQPSILTPEF